MMNRIIRGVSSIICILIIFCGTVFAEKTVVTAEGKYVMGDLDSKQTAKSLALMEAKRLSLEKAGTYIESISEVKDFEQACTMKLPRACQRADVVKQRMVEMKRNDIGSRPPGRSDHPSKTALENIKKGHKALQTQRWNDAIAAFQHALDIDSTLAEPYAGMSLAFHYSKQPAKAIEMANKALQMDPKSATGNYAMARIMDEDGKYDDALESVNRAIDLYPKSPNYFFHRGDIYMKLQNGESALKDYAQACKMNFPQACRREGRYVETTFEGKQKE